ncbi:MAG: hypothetical protein AUK44_00285 [Porphyromonadaceae bacterium CG2_30_38_12]|nr:MAG: hypothetical protein AUK44_00285 [Porphyromonadaceae bacterium CG2_30_38_12]
METLDIKSLSEVGGKFIQIDGEQYFEIMHSDAMQPFFISLASDSNHWMYIASTGGLSAGRKSPDIALFPYYTDDKITESAEITGSKTIFQVIKGGVKYLWEPFSDRNKGTYTLEQSLAKNTAGNKLVFTEINHDLGLTFSYAWMNADDFGWIKKSKLSNQNVEAVEVYVVDGLQNILPSGIDKFTQNTFSTLVDGYKKTELLPYSSLALFRMEAILVDRPEPSESLRANTVWSIGFDHAIYLLSSKQLNHIRTGLVPTPETEAKGVRGAYFACNTILVGAGETKTWYFVAEVEQDVVDIINTKHFIQNTVSIADVLEQNIAKGTSALRNIVAQADGVQESADQHDLARHFSNVLFNTMRGGIYSDNYNINAAFFSKHVLHFNISCWNKHREFLQILPALVAFDQLEELVANQHDPNLYRLFLEYLPLTFSRRHGDPSRPWNAFNINIKDKNGNKLLSYQGNWRDIFQNWEALSLSYPAFINNIIAKFVNATTADGYNAYKITNQGIEWEVIEPDNPWSNIGYWGDHQIIYLLKLMEISHAHYPASLLGWLNKPLFSFANVPYRIKSYSEMVEQPKNTIRFDDQLHRHIEKVEKEMGADAKLILNKQGDVKLVTFTEKILATLLAKLSNFIPEAGIWMNTLRPEWNDANNALVGTGASMVTLYYMRRFVAFAKQLFAEVNAMEITISKEMYDLFESIFAVFVDFESNLEKGFSDAQRRLVANALGNAGSLYRTSIYDGHSEQTAVICAPDLVNFFNLTLQYLDQSIAVNKREDGMYHAYNLVSFKPETVQIRHLYEMLEGQVSVLSAGKLSPTEALSVLNALRKSSLYRTDQQSYILYPNKKLPLLLDKNNIDSAVVNANSLLHKLVLAGNSDIVKQDIHGNFHFNANFNNAAFLLRALQTLKVDGIVEVNDNDINSILNIYEQVFDHQSFTGRSGTFYKYEGLGCIYWHMVSKLLLAISENIQWAIGQSADKLVVEGLQVHYDAVKAGIGAHKSPADYGAFPFDPYSHTPTMAGVQQPGMTGQVKEDIISRFAELGISITNGCLRVDPFRLKKTDFLQPNNTYLFPYIKFTYCSIPFVYQQDGKKGIEVIYANTSSEITTYYSLNVIQSNQIFNRSADISKIVIHL